MTKNQALTITAAATLVLAPVAFADTNTNNGAGNVNQSGAGNTQIIGNGNNSPGSNSPTAKGGNATSNSNASATSRNTNTNLQGQAQGQRQAQHQSQRANSKVDSSGNSANSYSTRQAASSAAPNFLTASEDTCMGSTAAGAQGASFGLSLGSTWHDPDCVRRKDARELYNMGHKKAALALLSQSKEVRDALEAAGDEYPGRVEALAPAAGDEEPVRERQAHNAPTDGVVYEYPSSTRNGW